MLFKKTEKKPKPKETLSEAILGIAAVLVSGLFIITFIVLAIAKLMLLRLQKRAGG